MKGYLCPAGPNIPLATAHAASNRSHAGGRLEIVLSFDPPDTNPDKHAFSASLTPLRLHFCLTLGNQAGCESPVGRPKRGVPAPITWAFEVVIPHPDDRDVLGYTQARGGVNALMGDGRVMFAKNSISINIWAALSSAQGGEVISSDSY